jgi:hypothetical protein
MKTSLRAELGTLFWLQWKLTLATFRSRRAAEWIGILRRLLIAVQMIFALPVFVAIGIGLAVFMIWLSPQAAFEVAVLVNTFLLLAWLLAPNAYSSQMLERFEMSRLFPHPISFRGIVIGSTLISALTMTGIWTLPLLAGQAVALAYHAPLSLPLILLGAIPVFGLLALTGRVMDDLFDLVSSDRRLQALVLLLVSLPMILLGSGIYLLQYATQDFTTLPGFLDLPLFRQLGQANNVSEFLEILRPSRLLIWLPPGWTTAGMGLAATGAWGKGVFFLLLSFVTGAAVLGLHARITRRLMAGAALRVGPQTIRARRRRIVLPGPPALWALVHKDLVYFWRSPIPRQSLFASLLMTVIIGLSLARVPIDGLPPLVQTNLPLLLGILFHLFVSMASGMALTANYFGAMDREGFGTLMVSALDRRMIFLSANLATLLFSLLLHLIPFLAIAVTTDGWLVLPLLIYIVLCSQVGAMPVYGFASVLGAYRTELKFGARNQGGNLWGLIAWVLSEIPIVLLIVLPYFLWKPAFYVTLPLCGLYAVGLYLLTLKPLGRFFLSREYEVFQAITSD